MRHTHSTYVYENRSNGHCKDYRIEVDYPLHTVRLAWGRIGGAKQRRIYVFDSLGELDEFVLETVMKRHARGYVQTFSQHEHEESCDFSLDILEMTAP